MEEPLAAEPTLPRGGAHDKGDPTDMSGYEEAWTTVETSADLAGAGMESTENAPSSVAHDPPAVAKQATPTTAPVMGVGLRCPV